LKAGLENPGLAILEGNPDSSLVFLVVSQIRKEGIPFFFSMGRPQIRPSA
jgi:hypothetical protein